MRSVCGTLFGGDKPRVIEIEGIGLGSGDVAANMLFTRNEDKPGFIGALGSLLGEIGVNVATFALGRDHAGRQRDRPDRGRRANLGRHSLPRVQALPHVTQAKALRF